MEQHSLENNEIMQSVPFFSELSETQLSDILKYSCKKDYKKGEGLAFYGDGVNKFYVICHGWIKLFRETIHGEEIVIDFLTRGNTLGETLIFRGAKYPYSVEIIEDAQILEIPIHIICKEIQKDPETFLDIMNHVCQQMTRYQKQSEQARFMNALQRLGCFLLRLSMQTGERNTIPLPLSKKLIAAYLHMKPETFSRKQNELKAANVSFQRSNVYISDIKALEKFCCEGCPLISEECEARRCALLC